MNISVGSTSEHKLGAIREACRIAQIDANVTGVVVNSGVSAQPTGLEETYRGARLRAVAAMEECPADCAIGIESGIIRVAAEAQISFDVAVIFMLTSGGREIVTLSEGMALPEECVRIAEARGFSKTTVGSIVAEKYGGDPTDPHSTLSGGKVTRMGLITDVLVHVLKQMKTTGG